MGTIYGVTLTSAVVQNTLVSRLPAALGPIAGLDEVSSPTGSCFSGNRVSNGRISPQVVEKLRRSVFVIDELPLELQVVVRSVYGDALRVAFSVSSSFALLAFMFSWAVKSGSLRRTKS